MDKVIRRQRSVHYAASAIGGFWGGYTILNYMDIFANAQTGNLIKLVLGVTHGDFRFAPFMALGFLIYCGGNVFYVLVRRRVKISMKIVSLLCAAAAVALVGVLSLVSGGFVVCYPIMFAAPIQWNAFKIADGNASSTIFSSNNVRQASILTTNYFLDRTAANAAKARFYWLTLLSFHMGVALAGVTGLLFCASSIWFCYLPIGLTAVLYCRYKGNP